VPDWLVWLIIAGVLAAAEATSLTLVLAMAAGGASMAALVAAIGVPVVAQIFVAIGGTLLLLWLVRPVAVRHLHPGSAAAITGSDALIGEEALVLADVTRDGGRVRLRGGEWSARSADPAQRLTPGTLVTVIAIDGATAVVYHEPISS
jgi:membrane protein implicated in regulation of membrane protease activity